MTAAEVRKLHGCLENHLFCDAASDLDQWGLRGGPVQGRGRAPHGGMGGVSGACLTHRPSMQAAGKGHSVRVCIMQASFTLIPDLQQLSRGCCADEAWVRDSCMPTRPLLGMFSHLITHGDGSPSNSWPV